VILKCVQNLRVVYRSKPKQTIDEKQKRRKKINELEKSGENK